MKALVSIRALSVPSSELCLRLPSSCSWGATATTPMPAHEATCGTAYRGSSYALSCNLPRECCYALSCDSEDSMEGQSRGRPCLQGRPARIVVVSSRAHEMGAIDLQDLHYRNRRYSSWGAYGELPLVVTIVMMIGSPMTSFWQDADRFR